MTAHLRKRQRDLGFLREAVKVAAAIRHAVRAKDLQGVSVCASLVIVTSISDMELHRKVELMGKLQLFHKGGDLCIARNVTGVIQAYLANAHATIVGNHAAHPRASAIIVASGPIRVGTSHELEVASKVGRNGTLFSADARGVKGGQVNTRGSKTLEFALAILLPTGDLVKLLASVGCVIHGIKRHHEQAHACRCSSSEGRPRRSRLKDAQVPVSVGNRDTRQINRARLALLVMKEDAVLERELVEVKGALVTCGMHHGAYASPSSHARRTNVSASKVSARTVGSMPQASKAASSAAAS